MSEIENLCSISCYSPTAIPEDQPKKSVNDKETMAMLKAEWEAMTEEEQEAFTKDRLA